MPKTILLVLSPEEQQTFALIGVPKSLWKSVRGLQITQVASRAEAAELLRALPPSERNYDLIVISGSLARDEASPVADDGGLLCCKLVRFLTPSPILLVVQGLTNQISKRCALLPDPHPIALAMSETIASDIAEQLLSAAVRQQRLDVRIIADDDGWRYKIEGVDFTFDRGARLKLPDTKFWGKVHQDSSDWFEDFKRIGQSIMEWLCHEEMNHSFRAHLEEGLAAAGASGQTRVSFVVDRTHYELILEAITSPLKAPPDLWMLQAPIWREIRKGRYVEPIGRRSGPAAASRDLFTKPYRALRCLLVCADSHGATGLFNDEGQPLELPALRRIGKECKAVERLLRQADEKDERISIEHIQLLGGESDRGGPVTKARLLQALQDPRGWDLIHFAGHTLFQPMRDGLGRAFLFVGTTPPERIEFDAVAPAFDRVRLLYLSSCSSGSAGFAAEAAKRGVAAVVGYRWDVEDEAADLHARTFYRELLKSLCVDTAFWQTRCRVKKVLPERSRSQEPRSPRQLPWASAMLLHPYERMAAG